MENLGRENRCLASSWSPVEMFVGVPKQQGGTLLKGVKRNINSVRSLVLSREPLPSARTAGAKSHSEGKQLG